MRWIYVVFSLLAVVSLASPTAAGLLSAPGPNPNWTEMQKFEWYLGYMAKATQTCGAFEESGRLHALARMTPYGRIGLGAVTGDGFSGPVCGRINNDAKELVADELQIRAYIEATYKCIGEACHGKSLASEWRSHTCGDVLAEHLSSYGIEEKDVRAVGFTNVRHSGATLDYQARVRLKSCQGSIYVDLNEHCRVEKNYTRGDCTIEGIKGY